MELDRIWRRMSDKKLTIRERWRKAMTADNIVDFSVDMFLIFFDVLSSPILIVMRLIRWVINKFFVTRCNKVTKWPFGLQFCKSWNIFLKTCKILTYVFVSIIFVKSSRNKKDLNYVTAARFSVSFSQLPAAKKHPKAGSCEVI